MSKDKGWIRIHRQLRQHWLWQDPVKLKWWLDILLSVNHQPNKINLGNRLFECKRGQSVKSLQTWATEWKTKKDTVRNFFKLLEKDNMILLENISKSTRITVCNYDTYQVDLHDTQTQHQRNTNAIQTQSHPNNNENNINNENNENKGLKGASLSPSLFEKENPEGLKAEPKKPKEKSSAKKEKVGRATWKEHLQMPYASQEFADKWEEYNAYRENRKKGKIPFETFETEQRLLSKLSQFNEEFAIEQINLAMEGCWQGLVFRDTSDHFKKYLANRTKSNMPGNSKVQERISTMQEVQANRKYDKDGKRIAA